MKGVDKFCASQASTASYLSMDDQAPSSSSSSASSTILLGGGGRAIDRYNPIITDSRRFGKTLPHNHNIPSCSSQQQQQPPITPNKALNQKPIISNKKNKKKINIHNNKSSINNEKNTNNSAISFARKSWSCTGGGEFISPPGSTRYLLSDQAAFFNVISEFDDPVLTKILPPAEPTVSNKSNKAALRKDESSFNPSSSSSHSPDQEVVLRVSLHCRGCERKMRKHISRMEGVSTFDIDFAAKKVTVVGNVTPMEVLASISKVKNAQLWTPPAVPSFNQTNSSEINKNNQATVISS
ncbi:hypothetical protein ACH5RR_005377 [Cinchona calisaya]|uniref:HMA domain-containing protein n=1 Tax=Cinchona calisaya TaxID=153742 RepID=A0ABD3AKZ9_9GENT